MSFSLAHGKVMDPGPNGISGDQLPALGEGTIDLNAWFDDAPGGADAALELEIGTGKGTFLIQEAPRTPLVNYIGLEWARAFWRFAADRCRRHGLKNVKVVQTEAGLFLRNFTPDACFARVHIYFPDPWPKKRHHKRRLVQEPFLRLLHGKLKPSGTIRLVTDHHDYFLWMDHQVERVSELFDRVPFEGPASADVGERVGTNFERKYARENRTFHSMALQKKP